MDMNNIQIRYLHLLIYVLNGIQVEDNKTLFVPEFYDN
jgi:hypothetical protein